MNDTSSHPLGVAGSLRQKRIFLTGATGFVGRVLVERLLSSVPEAGRLLLLIRPDGERSAGERLRQDVLGSELFDRLRAIHGDGWEAWIADKVEAVPGDLGQDRFGLDPEAWAALSGRIDLIVASAATVTFDERLDRAFEANTLGAARVLALARAAGNVPLLHVSTCFVSGRREGPIPEEVIWPAGLDLEQAMAELAETSRRLGADPAAGEAELVAAGAAAADRYGFHDVYTLTKALAELLLVRDGGPVPLTIVRPAIVESAAREPIPGWIDGVRVVDPMLVAYGRGRLPEFPGSPEAVFDIVPVDHVAHAILAALAELAELAESPGGAPRVYQVSSSRHPVTLAEIVRHAREGFTRHPLRDGDGHPIAVGPAAFVDPARFAARLERRRRRARLLAERLRGTRFGPRLGSALRTLDHLVHLLAVYRPYLDHRARYDDRETQALWSRLSAADREALPFDATALDWRSYLAETHVPGLIRHALRAETGAPEAAPPVDDEIARRHARGGSSAEGASTLFELFAETARLAPDTVAFQVCRQGRWLRYTYAQAMTATANVAHRLETQYGIGRGDRVVLWSPGCPEWMLAALALYRLGAVNVPLDPQWPAAEVEAAARLTGAKLIAAAPGLRAALGSASVPVVALAAPFVPAPHVGLLPGAAPRPPVGGPEDLASLLFTSGTTVAPKGVPLTHANFLSNLRPIVQIMRSTRERALSVLPIHHVFEFVMGQFIPMDGAGTITYISELKPAELSFLMRTTRPTLLVAVPRMLELLHGGIRQRIAAGGPALGRLFRLLLAVSAKTGGRHGRKLFGKVHASFGGSLRRIVTGGSALDAGLGKSFALLGFPISEGYGMTETSPVMSVNPWDAIRLGSVGKALPGVEFDLRPIEGCEPGSGEIWVRGPNVMAGYYENPEATAAAMRDGWLNTGDIGRFDADGYLYLVGRSKDVIVTDAGKNVYPEEVEGRYRGVPGVQELVVLGLPSAAGSGGERVAAVIVPQPGASEESIREALEARSAEVPSYQQIAQIEIWKGDLPKTTTQKVRRGQLRQAVLDGKRGEILKTAPAAGPAAPAPSKEEAWVIATLARLTQTRPDILSADQRLNDLGLDSLSKVELIGELEARFGRKVDDSAVASLRKVRDLFDLAGA